LPGKGRLAMRSSLSAGRPSPDPQFEVKITGGSPVISAVPFPGKFEAHTIVGAARDHGSHDLPDLISAAAPADGARDLGDRAGAMTPGAAVGGREHPEGSAVGAGFPARGAGLPCRARPDSGALADPAALHPCDLDRRPDPPLSLFRGERQREAKIGAPEGPSPWLSAGDSHEGKEVGTEISEYLLTVAETLEALFPETLVTPLIIKRASVSIAQHMVRFGYQLEPFLGADVAGIAVRMVAESELTKATLDIIEGRAPRDTKNLIIVAVYLHGESRASGNQKRPPRGCGAQYPMPIVNRL
jgi:hypothetical protein